MKNVLVSACLLGVPCRYDGKAAELTSLERLKACANLIPFCAEVYGGLPTPRPSAEIRGGRVVTKEGADVTQAFERGAEAAAQLARTLDCEYALLKDKSPSCGVGKIYSGFFDGALADGDGCAARALAACGVKVFSSTDAERLIEILQKEDEA